MPAPLWLTLAAIACYAQCGLHSALQGSEFVAEVALVEQSLVMLRSNSTSCTAIGPISR